MCTYNQHGRPHHLRDTLPEFSRRARFTQTPRKSPGLRMRWSSHRCPPLCINNRSIHDLYQRNSRGKSSPVYPFLRSPLVRTTSLKLAHVVVVWLLIHSHLSISYISLSKSQRASHYSGALPSSIRFIVVIIKYPLEKCLIGRPAPDRRCIIWLPPRRTPPLTGLRPAHSWLSVSCCSAWTLDSQASLV